jgi:hypothetical protein
LDKCAISRNGLVQNPGVDYVLVGGEVQPVGEAWGKGDVVVAVCPEVRVVKVVGVEP